MRPEKPVSSTAEAHDVMLSLLPDGREITFKKACLEPITIWRKINDGAWQVVAKEARPPFVDTDQFEGPLTLWYRISFGGSETTLSVKLPKKD